MVLKTISAFALYLLPFIAMLVLQIESIPLLFLLWIAMGFGAAFIGTSVMHDAIHESYTRKKNWKKILPSCTWLLGIDPTIWKTQHNVLHHSFTNIEGADDDIEHHHVLRFSPHQPLRWFHRYQHIYALFFYAISTLLWVIRKDFKKALSYRKMGLIHKPVTRHMLEIVVRKLAYFGIFLALPMIILPVSAWWVPLFFITMHLTAGTILSLIFQPAHVMEASDFIESGEEFNRIEENRLVHQLRTTTNFGMKSRLLTWFTGGLNFQIEHHLFPNICHVHYRKISEIVRETALEFGIPYHTQPSFAVAVHSHLKMLRALGTGRL